MPWFFRKSTETLTALKEAEAFTAWFRAKAGEEQVFTDLLVGRTLAKIQQDQRDVRTAMRERGWSARDYVIWIASREAHALVLELSPHPSEAKALRRLFELCSVELLRSGFLTKADLSEDRAVLSQVAYNSASAALPLRSSYSV